MQLCFMFARRLACSAFHCLTIQECESSIKPQETRTLRKLT